MTKYYPLRKTELALGFIATAALMDCLLCGENISGMGGPGKALCEKCGDLIVKGEMRRAFISEA